jgi:hypothetical protein
MVEGARSVAAGRAATLADEWNSRTMPDAASPHRGGSGMVNGGAVAVGRWIRWEAAAVGRTARYAVAYPGPERDSVVQSLKAAAAAVLAWALVGWSFKAPLALMAPWTALALVDATVYRSVRSGLQQFAVIAVGAVAASVAMAVTGGGTLGAMAGGVGGRGRGARLVPHPPGTRYDGPFATSGRQPWDFATQAHDRPACPACPLW